MRGQRRMGVEGIELRQQKNERDDEDQRWEGDLAQQAQVGAYQIALRAKNDTRLVQEELEFKQVRDDVVDR